MERMERVYLNKWVKLGILGAGSYGRVYMTSQLTRPTGERISLAAVKSARVDVSSTLQKEAVFLKELRGMPNVVQCYGEDISLENEEIIYNLLLEYASGGSLRDLIANGKILESHVAFYTFMMLRGISAMHECNIVHCDLKPGNILLFPRPHGMIEVKIADFGLSKKVWEENDIPFFCRRTLNYASPESVRYGENEKASDIWSLGCIVLEMITGKPIWSCNNSEDLEYFVVFGDPQDEIPEYLSQDVKDFLMRCLERVSDMRWTAKRLMGHPFIVKNLELLSRNHPSWREAFPQLLYHQSQTSSPFDQDDQWISTIDMFTSSPAIKAQYNPLFTHNNDHVMSNNKANGFHDSLGIPSGSSWIEEDLDYNLPDRVRWRSLRNDLRLKLI